MDISNIRRTRVLIMTENAVEAIDLMDEMESRNLGPVHHIRDVTTAVELISQVPGTMRLIVLNPNDLNQHVGPLMDLARDHQIPVMKINGKAAEIDQFEVHLHRPFSAAELTHALSTVLEEADGLKKGAP